MSDLGVTSAPGVAAAPHEAAEEAGAPEHAGLPEAPTPPPGYPPPPPPAAPADHDGPDVRVHVDRLERRVGPLELSPTEALRLAHEGRTGLSRRELPPDASRPGGGGDGPVSDEDGAGGSAGGAD